jgi:hypothetical protein
MPRIRHRDNPDYTVNVMDGAKPVGSQLVVAAGLLTVLLAAMSSMEAPMRRHDIHADGPSQTEGRSVSEPGLLCSIGGKFRDWFAVTAS